MLILIHRSKIFIYILTLYFYSISNISKCKMFLKIKWISFPKITYLSYSHIDNLRKTDYHIDNIAIWHLFVLSIVCSLHNKHYVTRISLEKIKCSFTIAFELLLIDKSEIVERISYFHPFVAISPHWIILIISTNEKIA